MAERRAIPGWEGYEGDEAGVIWSCRTWGRVGSSWHRLKPGSTGHYLFVYLCRGIGSKPKMMYVHHLVLLAFRGECPPGQEAVHLNDVQTDNRLENLEWGTHKRNCELRRQNGRDKLGEQRRNTKLSAKQVQWVRTNSGVVPQTSMASKLGVSLSTVNDIIRNRTWKHLPKE